MSMEHALIRLLLGAIPEAVYQVAVTRLLNMRSKSAYHIIKSAEYVLVMLLKDLGMLPAPARVVINILFNLVLPATLSLDGFPRRILRPLLLELDMFLTELLGTAIYIMAFDQSGNGVQVIGEESIPSMVAVYLMLTLISAALFELTISACNRADQSSESFFGPPTIALLAGAFVLFIVNYARAMSGSRIQTLGLICCWLALGGAFFVLAIARREAASQREVADAALAARKAKHTVAQVRAMAWRARGLEALRHSLASDVREVPRLAAAGQADVAARELSGLVEQAHVLNGRKYE